MHYLSLGEVLLLHARVLDRSGGATGLRDLGALQSALAQPTMTFDDRDLYPTLETKAATLAYSLVMNHPFVDGISESATLPWRCSWFLTVSKWWQAWTNRSPFF